MTSRYIKVALIIAGLALVNVMGCSDVKFRSTPQNELIPNCTAADVNTALGNRCVLNNSLKIGSVDILFVDDNSGSMSFEQRKMADNFSNLISTLDAQEIDYNIAITTTDISTQNNPADAENDGGDLQDGKFIEFPNGDKVLRKANTTASQRESYFAQTIERPETVTCETSGFASCPSGDERGIYAINKVLDNADPTFFRSNSLFAVVILSDEDVRSDGGGSAARELEDMDRPETLVGRLGSTLGLDKSMTVYSFIVPPGDFTCKQAQDQQGVDLGNPQVQGFYGNFYAQLSNPSADLMSQGNIIPGETHSICSSDYGSQLDDVASKISTDSLRPTLPCEPEDPAVAAAEGFIPVQFEITTPSGVVLTDVDFTVDSNNIVTFIDTVEAGSTIEYEVVCKRVTQI